MFARDKRSGARIRAFIAIDISGEIRAGIGKLSAELKSLSTDVKWVRPDGIHLTLKFLGDVSESVIPSIRNVMRESARIEPFEIEVKSLGAFPNPRRARVVWVGVNEPTGTLKELARRIEEGVEPLGFAPEDREFQPHLTLGRVRQGGKPGIELAELIERDKERFLGSFKAEEIILFKSDLKPDGAVYTRLETIKFGK